MSVYVGLDVHRKRTQVAVVDALGAEVMNRNVRNDPDELSPVLMAVEPGTPVVLEATYGWGWLADMLDELGLEPHLAHPGGCKAIASAKLKDDKIDARTLANLLRTNFLAEAWIAPRQVRDLRALLRHRAALVRFATGLKNRIHAVLADRGVTVAETSAWTRAGRAWLASVQLPPVQREIVDDCVSLIDALTARIARLEREIRQLAKPDRRIDALTTLPGIGCITAMTLVAEIGDISRFQTARRLCAWAGLIPSVRNSDKTVRHGRITKAGPAAVRFVLGEAAQWARSRPPFVASFTATAKRRGTHIATTKVARKLLTRSFHLLKELEESEKVSEPGCVRNGTCA